MTAREDGLTTSVATFRVVPVDELFANHDEFSIPPTDALAGRTLTIALEDGTTLAWAFGEATLRWSTEGGPQPARAGEDAYEAVPTREHVVAITCGRLAERTSTLAVLDLARGRAALVVSAFADTPDGVRERTAVVQGAIDGAPLAPMPRTDELAGLRVHHRYSTTHAFEHIYVDADHYVWHGIEGPEAGMGGFEDAEAYRVDDGLYLFTWHERASPFNGAILLDLRERRATGRLFAWHLERREAMQIPTGAFVTVLNRTSWEGL